MSFITSMLGHLNYGTIFILMLLESTVIPVPSEMDMSNMLTISLVRYCLKWMTTGTSASHTSHAVVMN